MRPHKLLLRLFALLLFITLFASSCPSRAPAQLIRWNWYGNCTTCQNGSCKPSQSSNNASKGEDEQSIEGSEKTPPEASEAPLARLFEGVGADAWEAAIKQVCDQRGIRYEALLKIQRSPIRCCSSSYASYAGCTWGGSGQVSKVDVVRSSCYDYEAVLRHEASHVVTFLTQPSATLFMHEGLSQVCERAGKRRQYLEYSRNYINDATNLIDWVQENDYSRGYAVYSISFAMFEYLREAGGDKWLEAFARDVDRYGDFELQLKRWYGLTDKQLSENVRLLIYGNKIKALF